MAYLEEFLELEAHLWKCFGPGAETLENAIFSCNFENSDPPVWVPEANERPQMKCFCVTLILTEIL